MAQALVNHSDDYQQTTLGKLLIESLDEYVEDGRLTQLQADEILFKFDGKICQDFGRSFGVKNSLQVVMSGGVVHEAGTFDNDHLEREVCLTNVEFHSGRGQSKELLLAVDKLKVVATKLDEDDD